LCRRKQKNIKINKRRKMEAIDRSTDY